MSLPLLVSLLVLGSTPARAGDPSTGGADAAIDALYTQARAAESRGDTKGAGKAWAALDKAFQAAVARKEPLSEAARVQAAAHPLALLEARVQASSRVAWAHKGSAMAVIKKNAEMLKAHADDVRAVQERAGEICRVYQEPEACAGATFLLGSAQLGFGDLLNDFALRLPGDMDGDGEEFSVADTEYQDRLTTGVQDTLGALAAQGGVTLQSVVAVTASQPASVWGKRAQEELARRKIVAAPAVAPAAGPSPDEPTPVPAPEPAPWSVPAPAAE